MSAHDLIKAAVVAVSQTAQPDRASQRERHDFIQRVERFLHSLTTWPQSQSAEFPPVVYAEFLACLRQIHQDRDPGTFIDEMRGWLTRVPSETINDLDQELTLERWYWGSGPCRLTLALLDLLIEHHAGDMDRETDIETAVHEIFASLGTCLLVAPDASPESILGILAIVLDSCAELDAPSVSEACLVAFDSHILLHLVPLVSQAPKDSGLLHGLLHRLAQRGGILVPLLGQRLTVVLLDFFHAEVVQLEQSSVATEGLDLGGLSQVFAQALVLVFQGDVAEAAQFCETELESRLVELLGIIVGLPPLDSAIADMDDTVAWMYEHCLNLRNANMPEDPCVTPSI